jgi:hypothetical protein
MTEMKPVGNLKVFEDLKAQHRNMAFQAVESA